MALPPDVGRASHWVSTMLNQQSMRAEAMVERSPARGRGRCARSRGFTIVELVAVMVVMGILAAFAAPRFFQRGAFDARAFTDQTRGMLQYAQKAAVAQGRAVFVRLNGSSVALCYGDATCSAGNLVVPPAGTNSGRASTRANCGGVDAWACEGLPPGIIYTLAPTATTAFYYDAQGKPFAATDAWLAQESTFPGLGLVITITGAGVDHPVAVTVEPETGYVH